MTVLFVVLGGGLGAPLRYATDRAVQARTGGAFPWGTLVVNVAGSFLLGLVTALLGAGGPEWLRFAVGVGFCGALTTYSTFGYETVRLAQSGSWSSAAGNVVLSLAAGLGAAAAGLALGGALA